MNYYVYRYKDINEVIIYVGRTLRPLSQRVAEHKLDKLWEKTYKIEYIDCENEANMILHEKYYINLYKPEFNIVDKKDGVPKMTPYPYEWQLYWENSKNSTNVSVDIDTLEKIYSIFNKNIFNDQLPMQRINIINGRSKFRFGFVNTDYLYENNGEKVYRIDIPEEYVYEDFESCIIFLLSSMMDIYYNTIKKIKINSREGRYLNKRFRDACDECGLICEYDRNHKNSYGWIPVGIKDYVWDMCKDFDLNNISIYRKQQAQKKYINRSFSRGSTRKYYDPNTNQSVRATREHILYCLDGYPDDVIEKVSAFCAEHGIEKMILE